MREIRLSGSVGGEEFYPLSLPQSMTRCARRRVALSAACCA